jgi:hypothetical protein
MTTATCSVTHDLNRYMDQQDRLAAKQATVDALKADVLAQGFVADDVYEACCALSEGCQRSVDATKAIAAAINAGDAQAVLKLVRGWVAEAADKRAEQEAEEELA